MPVIPLEHTHSVLVSSAGFSYTVTQPASVATTPGTPASDFVWTGGTGGNTTASSNPVGGTGTDYTVTTGIGGQASTATDSRTGGRGGNVSFTAERGGHQTATHAGTNVGGAGGGFTFVAGAGGNATNGVAGNTGGVGGSFAFTAGAAGTGGNVNGGSFTFTCGAATGSGTAGSYVVKSGASAATRFTVAGAGNVTIAAPDSGTGLTVSGGGAQITGSVGIGTAPTTNLHVKTSAGTTGLIPSNATNGIAVDAHKTLGTGTAASYGIIGTAYGFGDVAGDRAYGGYFSASAQNQVTTEVGIHARVADVGGMIAEFYQGTTERVHIKAAGNVVINAPASGVGLTVSGGGLTVTAGGLAVGTSISTSIAGYFAGTLPSGGVDQYGLAVDVVPSSSATTSSYAGWLRARSPAAAVTCAEVVGLYVTNAIKGASSTITSQYGILVKTQTQGGTNNYGLYVEAPSGGSGSNIGIYNAGTTVLATTATAGGNTALTITPGAHTAVTAESTSLSYAAQTITITGGYATQRFISIGQPTITAASALTVTTAATVYIAGAPAAAASAVITDSFAFWVDAGTTRLDGLTWIGPTGRAADSTFANAGMTTGITISQGTADDQVLAFKSSDVAHGITGIVETDTFASFQKANATDGGLFLRSYMGGTGATGLNLTTIVGADDTLKSTSARGAVFINVIKKSGTGGGAPGADANLVVIAANALSRFVFDAEGTLHSTHASGTDYFGGAAGAYLAAGTLKGVGLNLPHVVNKAASANVRNSHNAETSSTELAYTKVKTITITNGLLGAQRFLFDLKTAGGGATAYGRIYRNGSAIGTEQTDVTAGYVTKSEDLTQEWYPGDTAELWVKTSDGAQAAYVQNFRIAYDDSATVAVASANS